MRTACVVAHCGQQRDVTLEESRIELIYPADAEGRLSSPRSPLLIVMVKAAPSGRIVTGSGARQAITVDEDGS